jgi:hypothetical protein
VPIGKFLPDREHILAILGYDGCTNGGMMIRWLVVATFLSLTGCATTATLPYAPAQQPSGARISAAYQLVLDRLRIEIDTDGRRVEEAKILKADGAELRPLAIDTAPPVTTGSPGGLGIGIGGGSFGGRGGVGVGTGVSVGVPVGGSDIQGHTFAWFPLAEAGPAPWRFYVKLVGIEPTVILVGAPLPNQ